MHSSDSDKLILELVFPTILLEMDGTGQDWPFRALLDCLGKENCMLLQ